MTIYPSTVTTQRALYYLVRLPHWSTTNVAMAFWRRVSAPRPCLAAKRDANTVSGMSSNCALNFYDKNGMKRDLGTASYAALISGKVVSIKSREDLATAVKVGVTSLIRQPLVAGLTPKLPPKSLFSHPKRLRAGQSLVEVDKSILGRGGRRAARRAAQVAEDKRKNVFGRLDGVGMFAYNNDHASEPPKWYLPTSYRGTSIHSGIAMEDVVYQAAAILKALP